MTKNKVGLKELLTLKLQLLSGDVQADFAAIALYDPINLEFRWRLAVGSLNNRYTSIVVRSGRGIAGHTLKTAREMIINRFPEDVQDEALEYPILIVEELKSAVAIPMQLQSQQMGVLLIGQRTYRNFDDTIVQRMKIISEEILKAYSEERETEREAEEKREAKKSVLSQYFTMEKGKRGEQLQLILLDQRITLLSDEVQQSLISIFQFLFKRIFDMENHPKLKVITELRSEHQFSIQIETYKKFELPEDDFNKLADQVREISGSIEMVCHHEQTVLSMNFFLSLLLKDDIWNARNP